MRQALRKRIRGVALTGGTGGADTSYKPPLSCQSGPDPHRVDLVLVTRYGHVRPVHRAAYGPERRGDDAGVDPDAPVDLAALVTDDLRLDVRSRLGVAARRERMLLVVENTHAVVEQLQPVDERGQWPVA